jgi:hypothetical protein
MGGPHEGKILKAACDLASLSSDEQRWQAARSLVALVGPRETDEVEVDGEDAEQLGREAERARRESESMVGALLVVDWVRRIVGGAAQ